MNYKHRMKSLIYIPLIAISVLMVSCYENAWENHITQDELLKFNTTEAIAKKPELSTLLTLIKKTGYDQFLASASNITLFAPTNSAWTGIDTTNIDQLSKMIGSLIVFKTYYTDSQDMFGKLKSINGKNIFYDNATQTFNGAKIISSNLRTSNGVIQITDSVCKRKSNIWEYISAKKASYQQVHFIDSLNLKTMDLTKSIAIGIDKYGRTKYDTIWTNTNKFLTKYPIDNEDSVYTYVVLENAGFNALKGKYQPYFVLPSKAKIDSTTQFNVCQDFVFKGNYDITKFDTLTNVDGMKVPLKNLVVKDAYNTSNGKVYIVSAINIPLKNKIRPIKIEGENFTRAADASKVFTRYKLWASGLKDISLECAEIQSDTLYRKLTGVKDSVISTTYHMPTADDWSKAPCANIANFFIEYKTIVNSANYDVYYVAYDDNANDADPTYSKYGVYKIIQKLFVSMPGGIPLSWGTFDNTQGVANNYLGDLRCFVGQGMAGRKELTKLKQMNLATTTQLVDYTNLNPIQDPDVMKVPATGTITMWLCNTARSVTASRQGLLFLDYILLVPRIPAE